MANFFSINRDASVVKDFKGTGGDFIGAKSGMFPVKIKHAIVMNNGNGATHINLIVDYNGNATTIYRAFPITNNGGGNNTIGQQMFNNFCIACDIRGEGIETTTKEIPLGKDNVLTEVSVLEDFEDVEVILHIKRRFSWYEQKQEVTMQPTIFSSFRADDKASAAEIVNNPNEAGTQYEFELKSADKDKLDKKVTQEMVDDFLAKKSSGTKPVTEDKDNKPATGFGGMFSKV